MKNNFYTLSKTFALIFAIVFTLAACKNNPKQSAPEETATSTEPFFKLSLAQWSIHRTIQEEGMSPYDFAQKASEWGFEGLEYVNQLYSDVMQSEDKDAAIAAFVEKNNALAKQYGMTNVLIMIDNEGDLSASDEAVRQEAIVNHKRWVKAASEMGCQAVRLNLYGEKDPEKWVANSTKSLSEISDYAAAMNVNVMVENHGRITSNIPLLLEAITATGKSNCGLLPDFGNFCMAEEGYGSIFDGSCANVYDPYLGVSQMLPHAFGVSAKSYNFNEAGNETFIDYRRMLELVKKSGYNGFIGVEYEGNNLPETEGIKATQNLLLRLAGEI